MTSQELVDSIAVPASEAVKLIRSNDTIFIGMTGNQVVDLNEALYARREELENITLLSSILLRPTSLFFGKDAAKTFSLLTPFYGPLEKKAGQAGLHCEFTSCHLSELDYWFRWTSKPTVAFLAVSMPDEEGYVSFGPSGYCLYPTLLKYVDRVIVEIIPDMPYVYSDPAYRFHLKDADAVVLSSASIASVPTDPESEEAKAISGFLMDLIPDGATIQLGIGNLSTAIGKGLQAKNDLGVFSELFSPPIADLIRSGNVTNKKKGFMDGISVYGFALGDTAMYELMDHNESIRSLPFTFVNDPRNVGKNKNMISVNTAMSVNLYGEVAAEAMGFSQHSAVGGQIDFVKGAQWSEGGKSIIALNSTYSDKKGRHSKIVLDFPTGTPVTTPRSEVQYVATEYGCIDLKALPMRERVHAMISLAHPDFREELADQAKAAGIY